MRKIWIFMLFLAIVFTAGCFAHSESDAPTVLALYQFYGRHQTISSLMDSISSYEYRHEMNDINYYLDTAPAPEITYQRKWANCVGFARFISAYLKFKIDAASSCQIILMLQRGIWGIISKWHYVVIVKTDEVLFETSNNVYKVIQSEEQSRLFWMGQGYTEFQTVETWTR